MPNSTAVVTDLTTLQQGTFTTASTSKAGASKVDILNLQNIALGTAARLVDQLTQLAANLDSSDPLRALANNILGTLS